MKISITGSHSECQQGHTLFRGSRQNLFLDSSSCKMLPALLAYGHIPSVSASLFMLPSLPLCVKSPSASLTRTLVIVFKTYSDNLPISRSLITSVKSFFFPYKITFAGSRIRMWISFGDHFLAYYPICQGSGEWGHSGRRRRKRDQGSGFWPEEEQV